MCVHGQFSQILWCCHHLCPPSWLCSTGIPRAQGTLQNLKRPRQGPQGHAWPAGLGFGKDPAGWPSSPALTAILWGCEDISLLGDPGSLGAGVREGGECFTVEGLCKKKICIRICKLELLGQGGVEKEGRREERRGEGKREVAGGEGKDMGTGREGKDKRTVTRLVLSFLSHSLKLQLPVSPRGSFRSYWKSLRSHPETAAQPGVHGSQAFPAWRAGV